MGIWHDVANAEHFAVETMMQLREEGSKSGSTTGYNDAMMAIVVPKAKEQGYAPDYWCSPNGVNDKGRPYPYMIFKNLEVLGVSAVSAVIKVGDTVADIQEGKNAGILSVGVVEGSSIMALSQEEYAALSAVEQQELCDQVTAVYLACGADYVIRNLSELMPLLARI